MRLNKGFTLIELLVVISIIGMLTALIMVNFNAARERARDVQRKSNLDQIKKALRMYYNDYGRYPESSDDNKIRGCSDPETTFEWNSQFSCGEMVYMKILSQDPMAPDQTYSYQQGSDENDFRLWATLENKSDNDITPSQNRCSGSWDVGQYVVCAD